MASIYRRGNILWCKVKDARGKWVPLSTGCRVGDEASARRFAELTQAQIDVDRTSGEPAGPMTVTRWANKWLGTRREKYEATLQRYESTGSGKVQHRDHVSDAGRVRRHILPHLGAMKIADVRPKHLAEWIHKLRTTTTLGSHTLRNIYGLAVAMFRDAAIAGLLEATPAILTKTQLGEDEGSATGAGRYTREQFELMIGSTQLTEHARMFVALAGLGGLRLGAIAGLRWGDLDATAAPLWRLTSARTYDGKPTKTGKPSFVPVHPVLAGMLTSWRHGWGRMFGRPPNADDPIVARAPGHRRLAIGAHLTPKTGDDLMDEVLERLEIPAAPMKFHALRSTFISMALEDGADDRLIERVTHTTGKGRRAFDRYDRADWWPRLCAEVVKVRVSPRSGGRVVALGAPLGAGGGTVGDPSAIEWRIGGSNP